MVQDPLLGEGRLEKSAALSASVLWRRSKIAYLVIAGLSAAVLVCKAGSASTARTSLGEDSLALFEARVPQSSGPAFTHFSQIADIPRPSMAGAQGSNSHILDVAFSKVPGKEMTAGFYELFAGPVLQYTYTYEEFKYIVQGEFHLTDGTGQNITAKAGDLMYFPRGTSVTFSAPEHALGYYVGQRIADEAAVVVDAAVRADVASNPAMVLFPQIKNGVPSLPKLPGSGASKSYLADVALSKKPGKEMAAGFYHELAGPALQYTYTYEELKYIVGGEFHLTDGTGQKAVARDGDLVYFPKGTQVVFETPDQALGFFVGQRLGM